MQLNIDLHDVLTHVSEGYDSVDADNLMDVKEQVKTFDYLYQIHPVQSTTIIDKFGVILCCIWWVDLLSTNLMH